MSDPVQEQVAVAPQPARGASGCATAFFGLLVLILAGYQLVQAVRAGQPLGDTPLVLALVGLIAAVILRRASPFEPPAGPRTEALQNAVRAQREALAAVEAGLERRLGALERRPGPETTTLAAVPPDPVADQVLRFLRAYDRWSFNASRIREWGSKQAGFADLAEPDVDTLDRALRRLLAAGRVVVGLSDRGSFVYRAAGDT